MYLIYLAITTVVMPNAQTIILIMYKPLERGETAAHGHIFSIFNKMVFRFQLPKLTHSAPDNVVSLLKSSKKIIVITELPGGY